MKKFFYGSLLLIFINPNCFGRCSWLPKDVDSKFLNENVLIVGRVLDVDGLVYKLLSLFNSNFDYYLYTIQVQHALGSKISVDEIEVKIYSSEKSDGNFYFDEGDDLALYVPKFEKASTEVREGPCMPRHFRLIESSDREALARWAKQIYDVQLNSVPE